MTASPDRFEYGALSMVALGILAAIAPAAGDAVSGDATVRAESIVGQAAGHSGAEVIGIDLSPAELVVSADYPARFVVTLRRADGTQREITADAQLRLQVEDGSVAQLHDAATLRLVGGGETRLLAEYRGFRGSARVRVGEVDPQVPSFANEVSAVLSKSGCNLGTCHGNLHGKAGFRLSLRGDDPRLDFASITRGSGGRRIDWFQAEQSLLLRKPAGRVAHRGGQRLPADAAGYQVIQRWLAAGAGWDASSAFPPSVSAAAQSVEQSRVRKLDVFPAEAWLYPQDRTHRLVVVAQMADGSRRDVTRWARYEPSIPAGITLSEQGEVRSERPVDVSISVSYLDGRAQSRIVFLQPAEAGAQAEMKLAAETNNAAETNSAAETAASGGQRIDQIIEQRLRRLRLEPTVAISPQLFLRRLFLVVAGRLPSAAEVQQFLADSQPDRKQRWIERALFDDGYAYLWALRWSDLLRNEPKVMSLHGAGQWNAWLAARFAEDTPLDELVSQLVATVGSTYQSPAASFHRTHREPDVAAEALGQVFLGVRIQCARCHNHPFDVWRQDDYYGLAAYFTTVQRKQVENAPRDRLDKHIISGDEIISLADRRAQIHHPGLVRDVLPKPLDQSGWTAADQSSAADPLTHLAAWLTTNNRGFARNMANRVWYHVMGRGIVDPPDDFRISNPPSNPELLEYLTDRLIQSGYSTRALAREIISSDAFARQSVSQQASDDALDTAAVFAGYPLRRMSAEVLLDAISDVTGVMTPMESEGKVGELGRAVRHPGMPRDGFLRAFGKPDRLLSCECERSSDASLSQSLLLINGEEVRRKISARPNVLDSVTAEVSDPGRWVDALFLTALTRHPSSAERQAMGDYLAGAEDARVAAEDVLWALINSQEFSWIR